MKTSESITTIAPALVRALAAMPGLRAEADNPYFGSKYVELGALIRETRPILAAEGLVVIQGLAGGSLMVEGQERAAVIVSTRILHHSGEWFEETFTLPVQKRAGRKGKSAAEETALPGVPSPQDMGSAITYARRYTLGAILGVASEEDDDGNSASGRGGRGQSYQEGGFDEHQREPTEEELQAKAGAEAATEERRKAKRELADILESKFVKPEEREAFKKEVESKWAKMGLEETQGYIARWATLVEGRQASAERAAGYPSAAVPADPATTQHAPATTAPAASRRSSKPAPLPPGAAAHEYDNGRAAAPPAPGADDLF